MGFKKFQNVEPQKVGATAYVGSPAFMDFVNVFQDTSFASGPPGALPQNGSVFGLDQNAKLDKIGPSFDMDYPPVPMTSTSLYTNAVRYPWPEAIWPGVARGFHFSGKYGYVNRAVNGGIPGQEENGPSVYTLPVNSVTMSSVITVVYRILNGFTNQTLAGDLPNRLSPFFYPGEELLWADAGLLQVCAGGPPGDEGSYPSTFSHHSFHARLKVSRKMKQDDMICAEVRVRGIFGTALPMAPVVGTIDITGFYAN
jgi:hypothetical protein